MTETTTDDHAPPRIGELAVLPVFLKLGGRRALVAGGSAAAAWKAELLLAAGADVHVFAASLSSEMRALSGHPRFVGAGDDWRAATPEDFALAVADLDGEEATEFARTMGGRGLPVNVVDRPEACAFQFGSIVNRSPVVVGISTDGTAPILGQAIRRRIETLLPADLAAWGRIAGRLRARLAATLKPGPARRHFWEGFVDRVFAGRVAPDADAESRLLADASALATAPPLGTVTLVGAGPGDPEYLTLKGMRALQAADVILFDDLVSPEILEFARREAKRTLVGKRGGRTSCRQQDINAMMLTLARAGKRVVRLKAGDPSVFGRSGEETDFLERAGIAVSVVPGITAASALAAGGNTSLTHRDHAQAVRYVTGHSRRGELPANLDWRSLADGTTTTVYYMAGRTAPEIAARLLAEGMDAATPAVVAASVSRTDERRWHGPLSALAEGVAAVGLDDPVLIGIGAVFAPRPSGIAAMPPLRRSA